MYCFQYRDRYVHCNAMHCAALSDAVSDYQMPFHIWAHLSQAQIFKAHLSQARISNRTLSEQAQLCCVSHWEFLTQLCPGRFWEYLHCKDRVAKWKGYDSLCKEQRWSIWRCKEGWSLSRWWGEREIIVLLNETHFKEPKTFFESSFSFKLLLNSYTGNLLCKFGN